jgi:hypothetical protein
MKRKVKWLFQKLLSRKKQQELRRWLREVENLSDIEEKVIHMYELEIGRNLSDEEEVRSVKGLIKCQKGRDEFSYCQGGNEMRTIEDLIDF